MVVASFYIEIKGYVRGVETDSKYTIRAVMLCMLKVLKEAQIHCKGCNAMYIEGVERDSKYTKGCNAMHLKGVKRNSKYTVRVVMLCILKV